MEANNLHGSLEDLQSQISALKTNLLDLKSNIESTEASPPDTLDPSARERTPIKFTFVHSPKGLSIRGEPYNSYDGNYSAGCDWSELGQVDPGVQFGTFNTIDSINSESHRKSWQKAITFPTPFDEEPEVVVWLTGIDMRCDKACHVRLAAGEITEAGFEVDVQSSEDSAWYSLGFSWVAWPRACGYSDSSFDVAVYHKLVGLVGLRDLECLKLPDGARSHSSTVLAVTGLTRACGETMPLFLKHERSFCLNPALGECCKYISYSVTTAEGATGMYILDVLCVTCP